MDENEACRNSKALLNSEHLRTGEVKHRQLNAVYMSNTQVFLGFYMSE